MAPSATASSPTTSAASPPPTPSAPTASHSFHSSACSRWRGSSLWSQRTNLLATASNFVKIDRHADGSLQLDLSDFELHCLRSCTSEACGESLIRDFEKWIGVDRQQARILVGCLNRDVKSANDRNRLTCSAEAATVIRNCLFECCNSIRLWEFHTRTGVRLSEALP